jgi:hypothetical protein
MSPQSSGSPALRFGALFGLSWGVLLIANYYLVQVHGVRFTTVAVYILSLVIYLVAGMLAAIRTGKVSNGLLAGLWTGLFSSLLNAVGVTILLLADHALVEKIRQVALNAAKAAGAPGTAITDNVIIASSILALVVGIIVGTLVGLGVGALGGLISKSRGQGPSAPQPYQESLYRGSSSEQAQTPGAYPPPGQSGMPPQAPQDTPSTYEQ